MGTYPTYGLMAAWSFGTHLDLFSNRSSMSSPADVFFFPLTGCFSALVVADSMLVTSRRFFDFAVGDLYKPSFATITGKGDNSMYVIHIIILCYDYVFMLVVHSCLLGISDFHLRFAPPKNTHSSFHPTSTSPTLTTGRCGPRGGAAFEEDG